MPHQPLKRPRNPNSLSLRSLVILFLATLSVSFMLLLVLFQVVFKNIHLQFNTRTPETAPTLADPASDAGVFDSSGPLFERMGIQSASVQTPGRSSRSTPTSQAASETVSRESSSTDEPAEGMTDTRVDDAPLPTLPTVLPEAPVTTKVPTPKASASRPSAAPKAPIPPPTPVSAMELD